MLDIIASTIKTDAAALANRFENMPSLYGKGLSDRAKRAVEVFLEVLCEDRMLGDKLSAELDRVGHDVFMNMPPPRKSEAYTSAHSALWHSFFGKNAIHLEIGVSVAWPEERRDAFRKSDGLGDFIRLDFDPSCPVDVAASVTALPFADESIDRISALSLLEHVAYPHEVLSECYRVLKPGGALFINVPFLFLRHGYPDDYLRFTDSFFREVMGDIGFEGIETDTVGAQGVFLTTGQLIKAARAANVESGSADMHRALTALCIAAGGIDSEMVLAGQDHWFATLVFCRKPGEHQIGNEINVEAPFMDRHIERLACPLTLSPLSVVDGGLRNARGHIWPVANGVPQLIQVRGAYGLERRRG